MKTFKETSIKIVFFLTLTVASAAYATIYKWTDEDGIVHFSNQKEYVPEKYYDGAEKIILYGDGNEKDIDISDLTQINFNKEQGKFEDVSFGLTVDEFLKLTNSANLVKYAGNEKSYSLGNGYRLIGKAKVKVIYYFVDDALEEVLIAYSDDDERQIIDKLSKSLGEPDFKKFPFVYWFYGDIELKLKKDEDLLNIFKKKIKKF